MTVDEPPPPVSIAPSTERPSHPVLMFTVVSTALFMSSLDQTIVATALHSLQHGLHTTVVWVGWTITVYALARILMLPVSGKLGERYGQRRVFLASVAVFSAASLCCGLVDDIYLLIVLRAIQAAGGAAFTPCATGIVVDHFGPARDRAVGLFGSIFPIGSAVGPVLGGVFVAYWSWRGIFLVNVPIGALLIPLGLRYIPADPSRPAVRGERLDISGMALLGVGVICAMLAAGSLGQSHGGPSSLMFLVPAPVAVIAIAAFWRHTERTAHPLIPRRLIFGPGFGAVNVVNVVYGGVVAGMATLVPLYATDRYGMGALDSGTLLTAQGVAVIVLSTVAAFALRRTGYRRPLYLGCAVMAAGMVVLAISPVGVSPYVWLTAATFGVGLGIGWSGPASRNACLQLAPQHASSLASLRTMGRQVGSITSISIATAVISHGTEPGLAQAYVFAATGALLLLALPVIARVPEHRGAW